MKSQTKFKKRIQHQMTTQQNNPQPNRGKYSLESLRLLPVGSIIQVNQLPDSNRLEFASDSQDVESVREYIPVAVLYSNDDEENPIVYQKYDSYFVEVQEGDYTQIWGMIGIVPYITKSLVKIL